MFRLAVNIILNFVFYTILVVLYAYIGAFAGIIVELAAGNILFEGMTLTTIFSWIGVGLATHRFYNSFIK